MKQALIAGGGFYGLYLAYFLGKNKFDVKIVEKESECMKRASLINQGRVHNGYHYPRSITTALRSRALSPKFIKEFEHCINNEFKKYYCIGKIQSNVTSKQFKDFCNQIGAVHLEVNKDMESLVNKNLIEDVFETIEYGFDANKLRNIMLDRLSDLPVTFINNSEVFSIEKNDRIKINIKNNKNEKDIIYTDHFFNCTYSNINSINFNSDIKLIPLKHEVAEMALVEMPKKLKNKSFTIMCGPYFSFMPYLDGELFSFTHVRYTPHTEWFDGNTSYISPYKILKTCNLNSAWPHMIRDAQRYMPILEELKYKKSVWEIKTVLPKSESNDSRPILFMPNYFIDSYHCIMGGKIDNVYDVIDEIKSKNILN